MRSLSVSRGPLPHAYAYAVKSLFAFGWIFRHYSAVCAEHSLLPVTQTSLSAAAPSSSSAFEVSSFSLPLISSSPSSSSSSSSSSFSTQSLSDADDSVAAVAICSIVIVALLAIAVFLIRAIFRLSTARSQHRVAGMNPNAIMPIDDPSSKGSKINKADLENITLMGQGPKGKVFKANFRGSPVCIKELVHNIQPRRVESEMTHLIQVRHPSLALFMGFTMPDEKRVWVVSEFMERGSLYNVLHDDAIPLHWKNRIGMAISIAQAMNYLHCFKSTTLHRNLNSLNVLVNQQLVAKLSDYGLWNLRKAARSNEVLTGPMWTAPEVLKSGRYSTASDVYSFGVLLWELITRQLPFHHLKGVLPVQLIRDIVAGARPIIPPTLPEAVAGLIRHCTLADPSKRPSFKEVVERLAVLEKLPFEVDKLLQIEVESGVQHKPKNTLAELANGSSDKSWIVKSHEFTIEEPLGEGSFGKVYAGTFRGKKVAIKLFPSLHVKEELMLDFVNELKIMCSLHHPNTVLFMGACLESDRLCIIMEFCSRGTLHSILHDKSQHFQYNTIIKLLMEIAQGMNYLHLGQPPILHRDLKSLNVLVDEDWNAKVSDFGLTRFSTDPRNNSALLGTPFWQSPEVLEAQQWSQASDVYSYGVVMWEMFSRQMPFTGMNPHQAVFSVISEDARPVVPAFVPPRFAKLITDCWIKDPKKRPTFSQILQVLAILKEEGLPRVELSLENCKLYRKKYCVYAFPSKDVVIVHKSWGTGQSKRGDWVIIGPEDDVYTCDAQIFLRTYEPVLDGEPHQYRKIGKIFAKSMENAFLVETLEGTEHSHAGDYLAQNPIDREQWPIAKKTFETMYEEAPDQTLPIAVAVSPIPHFSTPSPDPSAKQYRGIYLNASDNDKNESVIARGPLAHLRNPSIMAIRNMAMRPDSRRGYREPSLSLSTSSSWYDSNVPQVNFGNNSNYDLDEKSPPPA